jgi:flagellar motor switch protein FliM
MERVKPYCRFPSGKGIVHQTKETKTFTPIEGSFLDDFLKQINSHLQQVYEHDKAVVKHIQQKLNNRGKEDQK